MNPKARAFAISSIKGARDLDALERIWACFGEYSKQDDEVRDNYYLKRNALGQKP